MRIIHGHALYMGKYGDPKNYGTLVNSKFLKIRMCQYGFKGLCGSVICCLVSRMSLSEFPFLYDIMGGTLKISFFSNGCCCIRYHFLGKISLRVGTAGWYCVLKGMIHFFVSFCWRSPGKIS